MQRAITSSAISGRMPTFSTSWRRSSRPTAQSGSLTTRHYVHDLTESEMFNARPGTFTPWETTREESDLLLYEGPAWGRCDRDEQHGALCRSPGRRRSGHQPRMDPEDTPRSLDPRVFDRSGHRRDLAPHAGLRPLHLPAIHADRHQFPARPDSGHVEPVRGPLGADSGRIHGDHPLLPIRTASISATSPR